MRTRFFPVELFGEPAWDLMLGAFASAADGKPIRLNKSHLSACVARTVAERRARELVGKGVMTAEPIKEGSRFRELRLTADAELKLQRLLDEIWFHRVTGREDSNDPISASGRAARVREISNAIAICRADLDALQLWEAGAHLSQAIAALEREA